jgi:hypothetical protein
MSSEPTPPVSSPATPYRDIGGLLFALGFIALGVWALVETGEMSRLGAVFPRTVASAMIVFAGAYVLIALLRRGLPTERAAGSAVRRVVFLLILLGWVLLLDPLGFFVASVIGFGLICTVANYDAWHWRRALVYIGITLLMVGGFQWLFAELLLVPLPEGRLFK